MKPAAIRLHLEPQPEGGYTVTSPDVPDLITEGETIEECVAMAEDLADLLYRTYQKHGIPMPAVFQGSTPSDSALELTVLVGRQWAA